MGHRSSPEKGSKNITSFPAVQDGGPLPSVLLETQSDKKLKCHTGQTTRDGNTNQSPQKDFGSAELRPRLGGHLPIPLAVASEKGRMENKACPIPYIPLRIFLFPLVKETGGKIGMERGQHWQEGLKQFSAAVLITTLSWNVSLPFPLCNKPSQALLFPPLIPRISHGKKAHACRRSCESHFSL